MAQFADAGEAREKPLAMVEDTVFHVRVDT
jgi:hypothetical protein